MTNKIAPYISLILVLVVFSLSMHSCRKQAFYSGSDKVLQFSVDTLSFDTVFTTLGTVTRSFKIENPLNNAILLDEIKLLNRDGMNTFRINVDGESGTVFNNVEILAKDFIYVFVEATVDPNNSNSPFVILDEMQYSFSGVTQSSYLSAWGQNAYFHKGEIYRNENITWQNDKPHVVLRNNDFPGVGVDSFSILNIMPGCQIYVGQGAGLFVDGELNVNQAGNQDSVVFRTNRVETLPNGLDFDQNAGLWQGIFMFSGSKAKIYNTSINNATWGIQGRFYRDDIADLIGNTGRPEILLDKVQIRYSAQNAILAINSDLTVRNSLFYGSGNILVAIALGGIAKFDNCTFFNNGTSGSDDNEGLILSNFYQNNSGPGASPLESASFTNCILYGSSNEELILSDSEFADFNYSFSYCLLKTEQESQGGFNNCIFNQNPLFENSGSGDFYLQDNSPCIASGVDNGISEDLYFMPRTQFDIGAIAYQ